MRNSTRAPARNVWVSGWRTVAEAATGPGVLAALTTRWRLCWLPPLRRRTRTFNQSMLPWRRSRTLQATAFLPSSVRRLRVAPYLLALGVHHLYRFRRHSILLWACVGRQWKSNESTTQSRIEISIEGLNASTFATSLIGTLYDFWQAI